MLPRLAVPLAALLLVALAGCAQSQAEDREGGGAEEEVPELGACRVLTPEDVAEPDNDSPVVDCDEPHTAQTFAVGTFPTSVTRGVSVEDEALGAYAFRTCTPKFRRFLGGDESLVLRSILTWAWFRPSKEAWAAGARWYRCDVVGGGAQSRSFVNLPRSAKGVLLGRPDDRWMVCAQGPTVSGSVKVDCSKPHDWRAVTTIRLGDAHDPYPGDRLVEVRTRDYCSDSVGAWLSYPVDYEFGYTWFHEAEWKAGNRRSICWAKTGR
ncbi:MAG TPA: septum formation family protein [Nocardioidaceae bacterium]